MRSTIKNLREMNRDEGGFTLIELLVVIVIIGILAGVVVFAVGGITDKGEDSAKDADKRTLETAEEAFYADFDGDDAEYAFESELIGEFITEASEDHDICVNAAKSAYVVVDAGAACGAGFSKS